jgi:hypothetical protein
MEAFVAGMVQLWSNPVTQVALPGSSAKCPWPVVLASDLCWPVTVAGLAPPQQNSGSLLVSVVQKQVRLVQTGGLHEVQLWPPQALHHAPAQGHQRLDAACPPGHLPKKGKAAWK